MKGVVEQHIRSIIGWGVVVIGIISMVVLEVWPFLHIAPRMVALDVGQGDAVLLQNGNGWDCLIDGGPDRAVLEAIGNFLPPWDRTLECMILTHDDRDHLVGLIGISKQLQVDHVYWNGVDSEQQLLTPLWQNVPHRRVLRRGDRFTGGGFVFDVLSPSKNEPEDNDDSLVIMVTYDSTTMLLTGDATTRVEAALIKDHKFPTNIDILKVGHHGSKTSTSEEFLRAIKPKNAIISAGRHNRYGHPHPSVLYRLEQHEITIRRTDLEGSIVIPLE